MQEKTGERGKDLFDHRREERSRTIRKEETAMALAMVVLRKLGRGGRGHALRRRIPLGATQFSVRGGKEGKDVDLDAVVAARESFDELERAFSAAAELDVDQEDDQELAGSAQILEASAVDVDSGILPSHIVNKKGSLVDVSGLKSAHLGSIVSFDGGSRGVVVSLRERTAGVALMSTMPRVGLGDVAELEKGDLCADRRGAWAGS